MRKPWTSKATVLGAISLLFPALAVLAEPGTDSILRIQQILRDFSAQPETIQPISAHVAEEAGRVEADILHVETEISRLREEIARLSGKIRSASGHDHWAFLPPRDAPPPNVSDPSWVRNPIDAFILARLDQEGLQPSAEVSRERLLRRVSLDLTGLPPTIEEIDAFLADESPDAYEKVVDRLLASPHYGERQAQFWLDLARYADTAGYHVDMHRDMWAYRDWVIEAFNRDLPFDQFTIEQLAGDMLPNATKAQLIATGFHRNTMFNEEGGIDPEEFRTKAVVDRVGTTGTVWMGLTLACAECHDHKYDPLSQKEFYQLYAVFNNSPDTGGGTYVPQKPLIHLLSDEQEKNLEGIRSGIQDQETVLETTTTELETDQREWEERFRAGYEWTPLDPCCFTSKNHARLSLQPDGSLLASGILPSTDVYEIRALTDLKGITAVRLETLPHESFPAGRLIRHQQGRPGLAEFTVNIAPADQPESSTRAAMLMPTTLEYTENIHRLVDERLTAGWGTPATRTEAVEVLFEFENPVGFESGTELKIVLDQSNGGHSPIGRFRLSLTDAPRPVRIPPADVQQLVKASESRTEDQVKLVADYFRKAAPRLDPVREELRDLKKSEKAIIDSVSTTLVMEELPEPRETFIHVRGNFLLAGDKVEPALPALLQTGPTAEPLNRLTLAKWLVSDRNPLVGRVVMNRLWQQFFGIGLVETTEDFGVRCEPPSHPELLDWLALEFTRQGWSMKAMRKLLVMSAAYRQSANATQELMEKDPRNRLLARGPRFRLDAEGIRDQALAASGLLIPRIGGPSVFPPQPAGVWKDLVSLGYGVDDWIESKGEDKYRRGLYTYIRRSSPYSPFMTFDGTSREYCNVKRARTNTPLQALMVLNDPAYLEAALAVGRRVVQECTDSDSKVRAGYAARLVLGRKATDHEVDHLVKLYDEQVARFRSSTEALEGAKAMTGALPTGEVDLAEWAAWGMVGSVLLNLDETVTKG